MAGDLDGGVLSTTSAKPVVEFSFMRYIILFVDSKIRVMCNA